MAHEIGSGLVVATSVLLFIAILALHGARDNADDATLVLFVIPIAICAMEFGLRGGLAAAVAALAQWIGRGRAAGATPARDAVPVRRSERACGCLIGANSY